MIHERLLAIEPRACMTFFRDDYPTIQYNPTKSTVMTVDFSLPNGIKMHQMANLEMEAVAVKLRPA